MTTPLTHRIVARAKSAVQLRTRPLGSGMTPQELAKALFDGANEVFDVRGGVRPIGDALIDATEGFVARVGPLAGADRSLQELCRSVADLQHAWDRSTGELAREFENLARKLKGL